MLPLSLSHGLSSPQGCVAFDGDLEIDLTPGFQGGEIEAAPSFVPDRPLKAQLLHYSCHTGSFRKVTVYRTSHCSLYLLLTITPSFSPLTASQISPTYDTGGLKLLLPDAGQPDDVCGSGSLVIIIHVLVLILALPSSLLF